jgi:sensor histidine kinase YesM
VTIRNKLFIFILALAALLNVVMFFIYQSGRTIQGSYNLTMDRILLYKSIAHKADDSLRMLSAYLIDQNMATYSDFKDLQAELESLKQQLGEERRSEAYEAALQNYVNLLQTYLDTANSVLYPLDAKEESDYIVRYKEAERTVTYIKEQDQELIDLELGFYQPLYKQMLAETGKMNRLGLFLFVSNIILCMLFVIWLTRSITRPIDRLVQTARQISKGNLHVSAPPIQNGDEIGILTLAFRRMLFNIRELIEKNKENMEKDRLVKELEIKALQSQINPHFLFNTLNVLSKLALIEGAERTSDLTVSISNLLRYNLRKLDQAVTLREEVENAREYFAIQQSRFRDRIRFYTDFEEEVLDQLIPSLTVQPLLENAFIHGIEEMEEGAYIRLSLKREKNCVVVTVADNGKGMDEKTRQMLLSYNQMGKGFAKKAEGPKQSTGLGTKNVFRRLQLFYGDTLRIEIESSEGRGTAVILRIPIMIKGELGHVPLVDR